MLAMVTFTRGNKKSLENALRCISEFDADFVGDNGTDYTRLSALDNGFDCTIDYAIDMAFKQKDDESIIKTFFDYLFEDTYWHNAEVQTCICNEKMVIAVSCFDYD